tara:strand:+ start:82 stop:1107 length:1026 start_codon:yes stop_codon:yes gene_type:complete
MHDENKDVYIYFWLLLITLLVALIIVIGGLTRLTDSGLSITNWDLFSGILPPLNIKEWEHFFSLYKEIPEYKLINSSMTLEEFKVIYWWEFIHRLLGRLIGILYLVPLIYFTWKKIINKKYLISFYLIFLLILLQGFVGWYMVKSGLVDRTDVSHYRLSLHLTLAFVIFGFLLWNLLKYKNNNKFMVNIKLPYFLPNIFLVCILLQISLGAFVSGLDAGKIYQTWPLMGENYFPNDSSVDQLFLLNLFDNPSLVQFIHRNVAYLIFFLFLFIAYIVFKNNNFSHLRNITLFLFLIILLQIFLGIVTVLSGANIFVASLHQIGSIILFTAALILVFKNSKIN